MRLIEKEEKITWMNTLLRMQAVLEKYIQLAPEVKAIIQSIDGKTINKRTAASISEKLMKLGIELESQRNKYVDGKKLWTVILLQDQVYPKDKEGNPIYVREDMKYWLDKGPMYIFLNSKNGTLVNGKIQADKALMVIENNLGWNLKILKGVKADLDGIEETVKEYNEIVAKNEKVQKSLSYPSQWIMRSLFL